MKWLSRSSILVAIVVTALASVLAGVATPLWLELVVRVGRYIPEFHYSMKFDYLLGLAWASLIGVSILAWPVPKRHKVDLVILWFMRCLMTLGFYLYFEAISPYMDAYSYYAIPKLGSYGGPQLQFGLGPEGTSNIYALVWLHDRVLPDSFHLLKVSWSLISFISIYILYRASTMLLGREDRRLLYVLGLFPSVLQWSSLLGKEPVVLLGTSLYVFGAIGWYTRKRAVFGLICFIGVGIVLMIRPWYMPVLVGPLAAFLIGPTVGRRSSAFIERMALVTALVVVGSGLFALSGLARITSSSDQLLQTTSAANSTFATGETATETFRLTSMSDLVTNSPLAIFTALFRPLPGEIFSPLGLLAGLENLSVLSLAVLALIRLRPGHLRDPLILWASLYTLLWAVQYGFTAGGNLGSLSRYRLQVMPIFIGLLLYIIYSHRQRWRAFGTSGNGIWTAPQELHGNYCNKPAQAQLAHQSGGNA